MMNLAQSHYIPAKGAKPRLSDLGWLGAYTLRGLLELVRARITFMTFEAKDILTRNQASKGRSATAPKIDEAGMARISYVMPRLSARLPWRSDCLIQALAAQNWLNSKGAGSEIRLGVENPTDGDFGAHAWLICNNQVVTGGEIDRYHLILADSSIDQTNALAGRPDVRN